MKVVFFLLMLISTSLVYSNEPECDDTTPEALKPIIRVATVAQGQSECTPQPNKLRGMCAFIALMEEDSNPQGRIKYKYQRRIMEAACVDPEKDNQETMAKKIAKVWKENADKLTCNSVTFDVLNGDVIKFAIVYKFDQFLIDMTNWKVDLNRVDPADGRTVLDYVQHQIERMKGTPSEKILNTYYQWLRDAGAKHKSEL
jgi:hypothetical protein